MRYIEGNLIRFMFGPRKGQKAVVIAVAAYNPAVDILTLQLPLGNGVTYAHSDSVELVGHFAI